MKTTIEALVQAGVRGRVKVIVGGAPVTKEYAKQIGADGFAENAIAAVSLVRKILAEKPAA
jgi:methanogenic corrinoid protein MtbC1